MPIDVPVQVFPPIGIDRCDGLDDRAGTATPDGAVFDLSTGNVPAKVFFCEELPDSPEIERGEQCTCRHTYKVDYNTGISFLQAYGRGSLAVDSGGNVWRLLSATLVYKAGDYWQYQTVQESISFDSPPDEFHISTIEINPALDRHPRYGFLTAYQRYLVQSATFAPHYDEQQRWITDVAGLAASEEQKTVGIQDVTVQAACSDLLTKLLIGEQSFYLPGFILTWSQYFWMPRTLNPGGYIEDPISQGGLPHFFWSPSADPNSNRTIFDDMVLINPQLYKYGISWLRLADTFDYQRTWFRVNRTWHGAPYAHWDSDLYNQEQPTYPPGPTSPWLGDQPPITP